MAGIYDIHCHLNDGVYLEQNISSAEIVSEAAKAGVTIINSVGYDLKSSKLSVLQAAKNSNVYAVIGIHPTQAALYTDVVYDQLEDLANANKVVAIGETGLDYSRGSQYIIQQKDAFYKQIELAKKFDLPLMIHIKDNPGEFNAYNDVLNILKSKKVKKAVIHAFEGNWSIAQQFIKLGYYISLNGLVTRNKELQEVAKNISLNDLMIESDAPYHAPHPYERAINHPKYLPLVVEKIAAIRGMNADDLISATRKNSRDFFL
ncbi:Mg-dependent DNase [Williamsoniiplasma somnilux]|uniref:Mg-dependent DNase n=1 Tax=Williamsoniiplasma somnilux TaxID=215578 RepID=A0A2K8NXF6_9MOLU|nr:TatD family hydrolase [Williamsoniiplasma somnilux]ATZ18424.1 Mg-dependent DNase [Williamsoniiplasma somnilux]